MSRPLEQVILFIIVEGDGSGCYPVPFQIVKPFAPVSEVCAEDYGYRCNTVRRNIIFLISFIFHMTH